MRLIEIMRESGRAICTGTAATIPMSLLAALAATGCAAADVAVAAQLIARTDAYVAAGGSTYVLDAPGQINGDVCDRLAGTGGINAAGALRRAGSFTVSALPNGPIPSFDATGGWWTLMGLAPGSDVAVPDQTAAVIAPTLTDTHPVMIEGVTISQHYPWPDDGRRSELSNAIVAHSNLATYDSCWVRMADPTTEPGGLLYVVADIGPDSKDAPQRSRLNPRLGVLTTPSEYQTRPSQWMLIAAVVVGALLAVVSVRRRAVEHANQFCYGQTLLDHVVGVLLETAVWTATSFVVTVGATGVVSMLLSPGHVGEVWRLGWAAPAALTAGAFLVAPLTLVRIRRHGVDYYLRTRTG